MECTPPFNPFGDGCYWITKDTSAVLSTAQDICNAVNGHLVAFEDRNEWLVISQIVIGDQCDSDVGEIIGS